MYTAFDAIEYLMTTTGGGAQDQEHRVLRQALFHAYRDLVSVRDWKWYHTVEALPISGRELVTTHTLPWGVQSVDSLQMQDTNAIAEYVSPTEWERLTNSTYRELVRLIWTIVPSTFSPDRFDLKLLNGYRQDGTATLTYRRRPKDLSCTGWEPANRAGTVNWDGSEAVGVNATFSRHMMGCVLRVSGDPAYHPESLAGMHPYRDEGLIVGVQGTGKLLTWSPAGQINYTGTKYCVTDYLDLSPNMYTALLAGCEVWAARLLGKNIEGATGLYGRDMRLAFEQDAMAPLSGRAEGSGYYYSFWYLRPGSDGGTGGGGVGGDTGQCPNKPDISGGDSDDIPSGDWDGGRADTPFGACA